MNSKLNSGIIVGLTKAANHLVSKMKERVAQNNLPKAISDSMTIEPAQVSDSGSGSIKIRISAPMAAAYEYGSGLHRMEGQPAKYLIKPKNKRALAFEWGEAKNIMPEKLSSMDVDTNRIVLPYVMHPGVKPNQYVAPTLIAEREKIKEILLADFVANIKIGETTKATMK